MLFIKNSILLKEFHVFDLRFSLRVSGPPLGALGASICQNRVSSIYPWGPPWMSLELLWHHFHIFDIRVSCLFFSCMFFSFLFVYVFLVGLIPGCIVLT